MKKTTCLLISGILVCSMVVPTFAENKTNAQLRSDFIIEIDGGKCLFTRADGSLALPILYNDTTYLPLRAIGEIMGKNVNWDESNKTITLSGNREETDEKIHIVATESKDIMVQERSDFVIVIDGVTKEFKTSSGSKMNPIVYNGTTYLPLRAIGQMVGKEVAWDSETKKVSFSLTDSSIADADSFETDANPVKMAKENENADIGIEKAKGIALAHAELKEHQVSFITEKEAIIETYKVEFYLGNMVYHYEIEAETGKVLSFDSRIERLNELKKEKQISIEQAKSLALSHAGIKNSQATFRRAELCKDYGEVIYEVEFFVTDAKDEDTINAKYQYSYEYIINALDGKIVAVFFDNELTIKSDVEQKTMTLDEAKKIALDDAGVPIKNAEFSQAELFSDNNSKEYEIQFMSGENDYDYTIDAATGEVLYSEKYFGW